MGATQKRTLRRGGAPQRRHAAPLDRVAQLGDALRSVGPLSKLEAAQRVVAQAVSMTKESVKGR